MATFTISGAGAHASAAGTDRIPASKAGVKGYLTPALIGTYLGHVANDTLTLTDFVSVNRLLLKTSGGSNVRLVDSADGILTLTDNADTGFKSLRMGPAAGAGTQDTLIRRRTGIANNSATSMITVTVPNSAHNAAIFLDILAHLGTGTDVSESSRCATGVVVLARKSGVDTVATVSTLAQAQIATVSGGGTLTLAYGVSAISGLSSATQTFDIQLTLVVTGTITDHTAVVSARLLNSLATGVTMAAAA